MTRSRVAGVGFSHIGAVVGASIIRTAHSQATFDFVGVQICDVKRETCGIYAIDNARRPDANFDATMRESLADPAVGLVLGALWANQHFIKSTARDPVEFDFLLPEQALDDIEGAANRIPYGLLRDVAIGWFTEFEFAVAHIRRFSDAPILLAPAPPPIADLRAAAATSSNAPLDALTEKYGLAKPSLRYKFWKLCDDIHRQKAAALGLEVLPIPPESVDGDGFRRPEYFGPDWIHGNWEYGALVLDQIERRLRTGTGAKAA